MNSIILFVIVANLNLYFLKDSPNLLVKVTPPEPTGRLIIYYSFANEKWDSVEAQSYTTYFGAVIVPPETINIIGCYYSHNNQINDNQGALFLYEVKQSPRMLLPLSLSYLEIVLKQARKKIMGMTHIDEAITLIDYVEKILQKMPYRKGSELEMKITLMLSEVNELKTLIPK